MGCKLQFYLRLWLLSVLGKGISPVQPSHLHDVEFVQHFLDLCVVQKRVTICLYCNEPLVVGDHAQKNRILLSTFINNAIHLV